MPDSNSPAMPAVPELHMLEASRAPQLISAVEVAAMAAAHGLTAAQVRDYYRARTDVLVAAHGRGAGLAETAQLVTAIPVPTSVHNRED